MAARRPLVIVAGRVKELPAGDSVATIGVSIPVYDAAGNYRPIMVSSSNTIPIFDASGNSRPLAVSTS